MRSLRASAIAHLIPILQFTISHFHALHYVTDARNSRIPWYNNGFYYSSLHIDTATLFLVLTVSIAYTGSTTSLLFRIHSCISLDFIRSTSLGFTTRYTLSRQKEDLDKSILYYIQTIFLPPVSGVSLCLSPRISSSRSLEVPPTQGHQEFYRAPAVPPRATN
jgi:hypothetical protein